MINLSVDGGGSKILMISFNEKGEILSRAKGSTTNTNFISEGEVINTIDTCFAEIKKGLGAEKEQLIDLENVYVAMAGSTKVFFSLLEKYFRFKKIVRLSEGAIGQLASSLSRNGLLALSGTGSDCFLNENGNSIDIIGGWGSIFGDEGSGYWMGTEALRAAVKSEDGRGEKTTLESIIPDFFGHRSIRGLLKIYRSDNVRKDVASVTKCLTMAILNDDDAVAKKIVENAADEMVNQAVTLLKRNENNLPEIVTIAGGGWKTSSIMIERFEKRFHDFYPHIRFVYPQFEPIIGGIIDLFIEKGISVNDDQIASIKENYPEYVFKVDDLS